MIHLSGRMRALPYLLLMPAFLLICLFKLYPIVLTVVESFVKDSGVTLNIYRDLFRDSSFWNSFWVTVKLNIVLIPLQVVVSFIFALLVNAPLKGMGAFRTIFYFPVTISITIACVIWNNILNVNSGVANSFLRVIGIPPQDFFLSKSQALWCIVLVVTWKSVGYWMMFMLAGLKNIDPTIYEAAKIDGSGWFNTVIRVTLPLIKRVLLFVCVANTTSNLLLFVPMHLITNGGPQESTNVLMFEAYKSMLKYMDRGRASAMVVILLLMIIGVCILQSVMLREKDDK